MLAELLPVLLASVFDVDANALLLPTASDSLPGDNGPLTAAVLLLDFFAMTSNTSLRNNFACVVCKSQAVPLLLTFDRVVDRSDMPADGTSLTLLLSSLFIHYNTMRISS